MHEHGAVHLFDHVEIGYHSRRDQAFVEALEQVAAHGYAMHSVGMNRLQIINPYSARSYELTFDEEAGTLTNVVLAPDYAMELLGGERRALLPPLYHNEALGLDAIVPLKFFTPDSNWTWYPSEFDGDDIFFGLVSWFEVELGTFSLTELESVRGGLGLPFGRDLNFAPTRVRIDCPAPAISKPIIMPEKEPSPSSQPVEFSARETV